MLDRKYRLISMVTIPLYGCVGSGRIANEKQGASVLLGRLLYTNSRNNLTCVNDR